MTNLIAEIAVTLTLATNWTGVTVGTNELGYVVTNHAARVVYDGATNVFQLKSVPSNIAVWRSTVGNFFKVTTNVYFDTIWFTNLPNLYLPNLYPPEIKP